MSTKIQSQSISSSDLNYVTPRLPLVLCPYCYSVGIPRLSADAVGSDSLVLTCSLAHSPFGKEIDAHDF